MKANESPQLSGGNIIFNTVPVAREPTPHSCPAFRGTFTKVT